MAVKNDGSLYPTESIVSKNHRKHYRLPVRSQHWQLRSLISVDTINNENIVYFPGGHSSNHIQRLNTTTREHETIKLLSFAPRCLVAGNGWLCCGSEHGEFFALHLDEPRNEFQENAHLVLDPDARLPLNLSRHVEDAESTQRVRIFASHHQSQKYSMAKSVKMAEDRVNCITLWFPPTTPPACPGSYDEPVAVLANNDKTVTLVNLPDFERSEKPQPLDVITYPDYVNRAIISPDGQMLIAILDDPFLYIHKRVNHGASESKWEEQQRILLKSQSKLDRSDSRGSFAACFSLSGAFLAIGTQHGTISIFETALLFDPRSDPLVTTFQSSRPRSGPGAIRDMSFCPGPFDILAWTEDRGHVGLADVRNNFKARQIVDINAEAEFDHISILDRNTIDPRLLSSRSDRRENLRSTQPATPQSTSTSENAQAERRRYRDRTTQLRLALNSGRAVEESSPSGVGGVGEVGAAEAELPSPSTESQRPRQQRSSSTSRVVGELLGSHRDHRERVHDSVRATRPTTRNAGERGGTGLTDARWLERLGDTVSALRDHRERRDTSYLSVLEILQRQDRDAERDDAALFIPLVNHPATTPEERSMRGVLRPDHGVFEVPPSPDNTAGLAWSRDGRTFFVGAQNGIYEFHVNAHMRKVCPSVDMR